MSFKDVIKNSVLEGFNTADLSTASIIVTLIIEAVALILIDRLWCKKEYSEIKKLKADIKRREERVGNK